MRKIVHILFLIVATLSASTPVSAQDGGTSPTLRFLLVGDSHAANLQSELRYRAGSGGHGFDALWGIGTRAVGWTQSGKLRRELKEFNPDVVLVCFGTNEAKFNRSVSLLSGQFKSFVEKVSDHGRRRVIWIAPPDLTGVNYLKNVREALDQTESIEVIDLSDRTYALSPSGVHLTHAAYVTWAWDIWERIAPMLKLARR